MQDRQGITDSSECFSRTNGQLAARVHVMQTGPSSPASPQGHSQSLAVQWHQSSRWWQNDGLSLLIQQRKMAVLCQKRRGGVLLFAVLKLFHGNVSLITYTFCYCRGVYSKMVKVSKSRGLPQHNVSQLCHILCS